MKRIIIFFLLSTAAIFILYGSLMAQLSVKTAGSSRTFDMVTVNNISVTANNLLVTDSLGQSGAGQTRDYEIPIVHLATFEIETGSAEGRNVLKMLYSAMQGQHLPSLVINKMNDRGQGIEERSYRFITVKEIILSELNANAREVPKAQVTIQANEVLHDYNSGGKGVGYSEGRSKLVTGNMFRLTMGNLPAQRAMRIGSIRITPTSGTGYLNFSVDISSEDARQWNEWLNTGAGGRQNNDGSIRLLDQTGQEVSSIQLSQVEIVSISSLSNSNSIPKTTIGLRTNQPLVIN